MRAPALALLLALATTAQAQDIRSPALLVIGDVVSLAAELGEALPDTMQAELRYA